VVIESRAPAYPGPAPSRLVVARSIDGERARIRRPKRSLRSLRMKHADWLRRGMQAGSAFHVKKKVPWRHNTINVLALCFWWVLFFAFMALAAVMPVWAYLPVAALGFGTLMFGWAILVIHECSHEMFIVTRSPSA